VITRSSTLISPGRRVLGTVDKRLSLAYGRSLVIIRVATFAVIAIAIGIAVALSPSFSGLATAILGIVLALYFVLSAISPLLTEHWVTKSRIILRQGWYFRAIIPFSDIVSVTAADDVGRLRVPLGIHRPFGQPVLFVTGGRTNLVSIQLREPRKFWQAFGLTVKEIVFDVDDRPRFLAAFEERRQSLPPVEPDRPYAELRN
jgi:hypothetical protein